MEKKEVKISSFQAENYRLQLIYVTKELIKCIKRKYEVRENRKIVCSSVKYNTAAAVYARCISEKLNCVLTSGEPESIYYNKNKIYTMVDSKLQTKAHLNILNPESTSAWAV